MYGAQIAFRNYNPSAGFLGSPWVGLAHFERFIQSFQFERLLVNTLTINTIGLLVAFPVPIILALIVNQLASEKFKKFVQTVLYAPSFISVVVIVGMIFPALQPRHRPGQQRDHPDGRAAGLLPGRAQLVPAVVHRLRHLAERRLLDDHLPRGAHRHRPRPPRGRQGRRRQQVPAHVAHRHPEHHAGRLDPLRPGHRQHLQPGLREGLPDADATQPRDVGDHQHLRLQGRSPAGAVQLLRCHRPVQLGPQPDPPRDLQLGARKSNQSSLW